MGAPAKFNINDYANNESVIGIDNKEIISVDITSNDDVAYVFPTDDNEVKCVFMPKEEK